MATSPSYYHRLAPLSTIRNAIQRREPPLHPVLAATVANDVGKLKKLLGKRPPKSLNINDKYGNRPLHLAVIMGNVEVFDYLLSLSSVPLEVENRFLERPLHLAVKSLNRHFALKLIRRGANVNVTFRQSVSLLHIAVSEVKEDVVCCLIEHGANVNTVNDNGETPLHVACENGLINITGILLGSGALVTADCGRSVTPFYLTLHSGNERLQEILFEHTFSDGTDAVDLNTVLKTVLERSRFYFEILKRVSKLRFNENELRHLANMLSMFQPAHLKLFLEKFPEVLRESFAKCKVLTVLAQNLVQPCRVSCTALEFYENCLILLESDLSKDLVASTSDCDSVISLLCSGAVHTKLSLELLTDLVCRLLDLGLIVDDLDMYTVYDLFGRCALFDILLRREVKINTWAVMGIFPRKSVMCKLMFDVANFSIFKFLDDPSAHDFDVVKELLHYSARFGVKKVVKEVCGVEEEVASKVATLPPVSSLVELSRDVARDYIVQCFNVKSSKEFMHYVDLLPIALIGKKILTLERRLY